MAQTDWRNSIVNFEPEVDAAALAAHPLNARLHPENQRSALRGSLERVGWVDAVKVNVQTGRIVDGHARVEEALRTGGHVPVLWVDLTEEEEKFVLATLDPIAGLAEYDADILAQLLDGMELQDAALQAMLDDISDGIGDGTEDEVPDDDESYSGDASLLDNVGSLVDDPTHKCHKGQVWTIWDRHRLVVADVMTEHASWTKHLKEKTLLLPYAGPYILMTNKVNDETFLMVQPDLYIAGMILDSAVRCHPDRPAPVLVGA